MKLQDLFESLPPAVNTNSTYQKTTNGLRDRSRRGQSHAPFLDNGSYAHVFKQPKAEVSNVLKIGHDLGERRDPYLAYVSRILELHNPYFPQVQELKIFNSPKGKFFKIRLEKLSKTSTVTPAEVETIAGRWYGDNAEAKLRSHKVQLNPDTWITYQLSNLIDKPKERSILVDEALIEALHVIDELTLGDGFENDMTSHNCMIRRTKYGPQVVLTDPVCGSDSSS
jgi:hypothetical protein